MNAYLVMAAGVVLGLGARLVDDVAPLWVGNVGAIWFLAAFLAGRTRRSPRSGASIGALCLVAACLSYYAWRAGIDGTISLRYLSTVGIWWLVASFLTGVVGGGVGATSRTLTAAWGVPAGVFVGEAAGVLLLSQRWVQVVIEAILAGLLLTRTRGRKALEIAAGSAVAVAAVALAYRLLLR